MLALREGLDRWGFKLKGLGGKFEISEWISVDIVRTYLTPSEREEDVLFVGFFLPLGESASLQHVVAEKVIMGQGDQEVAVRQEAKHVNNLRESSKGGLIRHL